jgi:hypothetical protein
LSNPTQRERPWTLTLYWWSDSQIAYAIGYAATIAMITSDGDTITAASFRSDSPERRRPRRGVSTLA